MKTDDYGCVIIGGHGVYAVGASPQEAIRAFSLARGWGEPQIADPLQGDTDRFDWGFRFVADGTGFKAAGQDVPGGTLLTWWK